MKNSMDDKQKLITLLEQIDKNPSIKQVKLDDNQAKQLARAIKKLLKQQLH